MLVRAGRSQDNLAREFEPIRNLVVQAGRRGWCGVHLTSMSREPLRFELNTIPPGS